jgi:phenylacetate-CoA ligase
VNTYPIKSGLSDVVWPALPGRQAALLLALEYQLDQSQWLSSAELEARQFEQLGEVLDHAARTVPFYGPRLRDAGIDPKRAIERAAFERIPLLTRRDIQAHEQVLKSTALPSGHGRLVEHRSGGSTSEPVRVYGTELTTLFWHALALRDHLWHRRDFSAKLCAIRSRVENREQSGWGPTTDLVFVTGPGAVLNIRTPIPDQLEWLRRHDPDYLLSHPTNVREVAHLSLARGVTLPRLREVRTYGEPVSTELRSLCREAWGARVVDVYSAEETGYIALQCPENEHYHVQSETLLIEILDSRGRPCEPGATGQVVVTTLHNFAMPLIRYAIGDYAEAGGPCPCGRGLPVVTRIHGRSRNLFVLPNGQHCWPTTPFIRYAGIAPIQQIQIVQHTVTQVEARYVSERALSGSEEQNMIAAIHLGLGYPFEITLSRVEEIPRLPSMKFEDFVSHVVLEDRLSS